MGLQHDAHKRLGSVAMGGVERVMKEDFFRGISFEALFEGHIPSPVLEMCAGWKVHHPLLQSVSLSFTSICVYIAAHFLLSHTPLPCH